MLMCRDCGAAGPEEEFTEVTEQDLLESLASGDIDYEEFQEGMEWNLGRYQCGCGTLMSPDA